MINKLLEKVIQKHGAITIITIDSGSGKFRITTVDYTVDCFEIEFGLIELLSIEKNDEM